MQISFNNRRREFAGTLTAIACCVLLAACGGSSASSSGAQASAPANPTTATTTTTTTGSTTATTPTTSTSTTPKSSTGKSKKSSPVEGLKPIKVPKLPKVTGALAERVEAIRACMRSRGIEQKPGQKGLPAGVTKAQFRAAISACEAAAAKAAPEGKAAEKQATEALAKFSACLKANGVGGSGGANVSSAKGKAALKKCKSALGGAFGALSGGGSSSG